MVTDLYQNLYFDQRSSKQSNAWEDHVVLVWIFDQRGAPCPTSLALSSLECARVWQNFLSTSLLTSHWLDMTLMITTMMITTMMITTMMITTMMTTTMMITTLTMTMTMIWLK